MIEPGIYFNMDEDTYHADPALGSSSIKQLLINPVRWWRKSPWGEKFFTENGLASEPTERETAAKIMGRATHCVVLEPHTFDDKFIEYESAGPEYLRTRDQIREALKEIHGEDRMPKGASLPDLQRAATLEGLPIYDDWKEHWEAKVNGRTVISQGLMTTIRLIDKMLNIPRPDLGGKSIREDTLSNGAPEVSVFWIEDDVRMKMRVDWLRTMGMVDVKTYAASDDHVPVSRFLSSVATYGYDLQREHYTAGWFAMADLIQQGAVFGADEKQADLIQRIRINPEKPPAWRWLPIQTIGVPEIDRIDYTATQIAASASLQRRQAIETYRRNLEMFGLDEPWVAMRPRIIADDTTFEASFVARRMTGRGEVTWETAE